MSSATRRLVIASNNPGKLREFAALLTPLGIDAVAQSELRIGEADEPHATFIENALAKARHASAAAGLPALADDSGICVPALGGAPGVYSARYAGEPKSDQRNNEKLVGALRDLPRAAFYYCALVLVRSADDPRPIVADGAWHGEIVDTPRGDGGFGYDPYFWLPSHQRTAAELPAEEKNRISHRGLALAALIQRLRDEPL
ncbi:MAG: RdgB/HAM1 family non-canonical purine NTP pyrophosphatase [Betaproteobacteria bacterium]|nr:RdgB/HAM1 family non-canonical purine NTP pyrophosphatase [Betaproteobacteria bacterium]